MIKKVSKWIAAGALVLPLAAHASIFQFNASLNNANELAAGVASAATATGLATLFYNDNGTHSHAHCTASPAPSTAAAHW